MNIKDIKVMNPLFIKNIRQIKNKRLFMISSVFYILLMLMVCICSTAKIINISSTILVSVVSALLILFAFCGVTFPAASLVNKEKNNGTSELINLTLLTPIQKINGSLFSVMLVNLFFIILSLPTLIFVVLYKDDGLNFLNVLYLLVFVIIIELVVAQLLLLCGEINKSILGIVSVISILFVFQWLFFFINSLIFTNNINNLTNDRVIMIFSVTSALLFIFFYGMRYGFSLQEDDNRMFVPRQILVLYAIIMPVIYHYLYPKIEIGELLFKVSSIIGYYLLLSSIIERTKQSNFVMKRLPKSFGFRLYHIIFSTQATNAFMWGAIILAMPFIFYYFHKGDYDINMEVCLSSTIYFMTIIQIVLLLREFFGNRFGKNFGIICLVIIFILISFLFVFVSIGIVPRSVLFCLFPKTGDLPTFLVWILFGISFIGNIFIFIKRTLKQLFI